MLDVVRMTRALRPEGIKWPVNSEGKAVNRLELLTRENNIAHENAHDALADVTALIAVARLIRKKQPQLFGYLLKLRDKNEIQQLINLDTKQPFVYTSGRYGSEYDYTTVAFPLTAGRNGNVVVYDLRVDPTPFLEITATELADRLFASYETRRTDGFVPVPVKELQYNRAPAVAPLGVLGVADGWSRLHLDEVTVRQHAQILLDHPEFAERLRTVYESRPAYAHLPDPESQLYNGFLGDLDRLRAESVRGADAQSLADLHPEFQDERLAPLLLHYKARNFPSSLSEDETRAWEEWRTNRLQCQFASFVKALERVSKTADSDQQFLVQELQLWAELVMPVDID
jgi:exodeoxyribonuclease-1